MSSTSKLFHKTPLCEQVADSLRASITNGSLRGKLPGEIQLARQLGVSRPTLRTALAKLQQEGLISRQRGIGSEVTPTRRKIKAKAPRSAICVISSLPRTAPILDSHPVLLELQAQLASQDIAYEDIFDARLAGANPASALQALAHARPGVCWVLLASSRNMQMWFSKAGLPALVLGSCHPQAHLPSVDHDYRAAGWHAAGELIRHGHNRIGIITPPSPLAGDLACKAGFEAYAANRPAHIRELVANDDPKAFRSRIANLFRSTQRPTALFVLRPAYCLFLVIQLSRMGLRIPEDISIVSRDTHPLIDTAFPDLTRYSSANTLLATKTIRLAKSLLNGNPPPQDPVFITPEFLPGETLAPHPHG